MDSILVVYSLQSIIGYILTVWLSKQKTKRWPWNVKGVHSKRKKKMACNFTSIWLLSSAIYNML